MAAVKKEKKLFMPTLREFGTCCGMDYWTGFYNSLDVEGMRKKLKDLPNTLAVLNGSQYGHLKDDLEGLGFREITQVHNRVHGSVLHVLLWEAHPELSPGHPDFNKKKYEITKDRNGYEYVTRKKDSAKMYDPE